MLHRFLNKHCKWCLSHGQFLAFVFVVAVGVGGTVIYEDSKQGELSRQVNSEVTILTRDLASPVPGAHIHIKIVRHPDGSATITQVIDRDIFVPAH